MSKQFVDFLATFNPDCETESGLEDCERALRHFLTEGEDCGRLLTYVKVKREAMALRVNGNVAEAIVKEARCDRIYENLPREQRW